MTIMDAVRQASNRPARWRRLRSASRLQADAVRCLPKGCRGVRDRCGIPETLHGAWWEPAPTPRNARHEPGSPGVFLPYSGFAGKHPTALDLPVTFSPAQASLLSPLTLPISTHSHEGQRAVISPESFQLNVNEGESTSLFSYLGTLS